MPLLAAVVACPLSLARALVFSSEPCLVLALGRILAFKPGFRPLEFGNHIFETYYTTSIETS